MAATFGSNPNQSLQNMLLGAVNASRDAVNTAQSGLGAVTAGGAQVGSYLTNAQNLAGTASKEAKDAFNLAKGTSADSAAIRSQVPTVSNLVPTVSGLADQIAGYTPEFVAMANALLGRVGEYDRLGGQIEQTASELSPLIGQLTGIGGNLNSQGAEMVGRANQVLDIGQGLLNFDPNSSAVAGEWKRLYDAVSPNAMAARAGSDVQANFDSAREQQRRQMARSGASVTSGNALSQMQKIYLQSLATAKAAAMTRANNLAYDKQAGYLKTITDTANQLLGTGTSMFGQGTGAEAQGANAISQAAGAKANQGQLFANAASTRSLGDAAISAAGTQMTNAAANDSRAIAANAEVANLAKLAADLYGTAGTLDLNAASGMTSAANVQNSAAGVSNQAASVYNSYLSNLNNAYGDVANAQANLGSSYLSAASTEVSANNGGGGGGGGGGVIINPSQEDDFMNWKGTGHSETWNKNNLPTDQFRALAAR